MAKTEFLDLTSNLIAAGFSANQIPAKLEGIAFGSDVQVGNTQYHTLVVANDNDYLNSVGGLANPNRLFVYGFTQADLPVYQPQAISSVPLPAALPLLLTALSTMGMGLAPADHARVFIKDCHGGCFYNSRLTPVQRKEYTEFQTHRQTIPVGASIRAVLLTV